MKFTIILSSANAETNWNAFRLANFTLEQGDEVKIFLVGEGVEYEKNSSEKFNIRKQVEKFLQFDKAKILGCGTCIKARELESTKTCPINTLKDLYEVLKEGDRVISF